MRSQRGNMEPARTVGTPRGQAGGIRGVRETPGWKGGAAAGGGAGERKPKGLRDGRKHGELERRTRATQG